MTAPANPTQEEGKMRKVSQSEFFGVIGPTDTHPRSVGPYPYTSIFENQRSRREMGRIVRDSEGASHYYLVPDGQP